MTRRKNRETDNISKVVLSSAVLMLVILTAIIVLVWARSIAVPQHIASGIIFSVTTAALAVLQILFRKQSSTWFRKVCWPGYNRLSEDLAERIVVSICVTAFLFGVVCSVLLALILAVRC